MLIERWEVNQSMCTLPHLSPPGYLCKESENCASLSFKTFVALVVVRLAFASQFRRRAKLKGRLNAEIVETSIARPNKSKTLRKAGENSRSVSCGRTIHETGRCACR
jgi:hypothetical protein